jgi:hypothetical protein
MNALAAGAFRGTLAMGRGKSQTALRRLSYLRVLGEMRGGRVPPAAGEREWNGAGAAAWIALV